MATIFSLAGLAWAKGQTTSNPVIGKYGNVVGTVYMPEQAIEGDLAIELLQHHYKAQLYLPTTVDSLMEKEGLAKQPFSQMPEKEQTYIIRFSEAAQTLKEYQEYYNSTHGKEEKEAYHSIKEKKESGLSYAPTKEEFKKAAHYKQRTNIADAAEKTLSNIADYFVERTAQNADITPEIRGR